MKTLTPEVRILQSEKRELLSALIEARDHLDYCGYGDSWERQCAKACDLPKRLDEIVDKYTENKNDNQTPTK